MTDENERNKEVLVLFKVVMDELKHPSSHDSKPASTDALAEGLWKEDD